MPTLSTNVDPLSTSYMDNRQAVLARLDELHEALGPARDGYGIARPVARERVELLLDRDAPFLELCPLAGWGPAAARTDTPPGAGIVGGIGTVEGTSCMIVASDPAVPGGLAALKKYRRLAEIAAENQLPLIHLADPAHVATDDGGPSDVARHQVLRDLAQAGAAQLPSVAVLLGTGAHPAGAVLSGYTIAVRGLATQAPVDFRAEDERDAIRLARMCLRRLQPGQPAGRPATVSPPKYDEDDLLGLSPDEPYEVLARLLDGSELDEFQAGPGLVTGWGELYGYPVGVLAGRPGVDDGAKAARFVHRATVPLLFLDSGAPADPVVAEAVATSRVPHLTVDLGGGTGMCGRAYRPRLLFSWPSAGALERSGRLYDDAVLDPRDTRTALGLALSSLGRHEK